MRELYSEEVSFSKRTEIISRKKSEGNMVPSVCVFFFSEHQLKISGLDCSRTD